MLSVLLAVGALVCIGMYRMYAMWMDGRRTKQKRDGEVEVQEQQDGRTDD